MEKKSPRLQPFGCQMASTGAELDTFQNIMSPTGSLWKALLHRLQRSTLKTVRVPQSNRSITGIQVVQLEHSSLHLCLSVHHQCPQKNAKNTKHVKRLLNKNQKRRTSKIRVPWMMPSATIQLSQRSRSCFLNGVLMPTSTGWHRYVHPPGMCSTSTPST